MRVTMWWGAAVAALLLAGCAAQPPGGVVLPSPGHAPGRVEPKPEHEGIQPGAPVIPGPITPEPTPVPETRPPLSPDLPRNIESSGASAPVVSLVHQARAALSAGQTDQAGASLERALRISPRNAWVWQALAQLHLANKLADQAESEARKSNSLGRRNPYLEVENWRLIAAARTLRGDVAGAADAKAHQDELQQLIGP